MGSTENSNVILLSNDDNVVVACEDIAAGSTVKIAATSLTVNSDIALGHKIARHDISAEDKILKYGAPIGRAEQDIRRGDHVHVHNMRSDYLHSHTARNRRADEA